MLEDRQTIQYYYHVLCDFCDIEDWTDNHDDQRDAMEQITDGWGWKILDGTVICDQCLYDAEKDGRLLILPKQETE